MATTAAKSAKARSKPAGMQQPAQPFVVPKATMGNLGVAAAPVPTLSPKRNVTLPTPVPKPLPPFFVAEREINAKYGQLGGVTGFLGPAISGLQNSADGVGFFTQYQGGSIYWSPSTGAFEVHGAIRDKWNMLGAETGFLGYPATDETGAPDGIGRYNHFQGGSIYWTGGTGAFEVHGAIRDKWASLGWERSILGYPVTDETGTPDGVGRYNHFQTGSIYWTPGTDAHEVHGAIRDKWASMGWERSYLGYPTSDEMSVMLLNAPAQMSDFQRGDISWTPNTGALATPLTLHFHDTLTSGLPLGGWVDIVLNSNGDITFSGSLHDSGFDNIDYTLSVVIVSPSGTSIGFQHQGHTEGTIAGLPFGTPNRDDSFVTPSGTNNQQVIANWDQLTQASLFWRLDATDTLTEGAAQILGDLAQQALKALGTAAVAALVALIFA